jgi:hypothetical protein
LPENQRLAVVEIELLKTRSGSEIDPSQKPLLRQHHSRKAFQKLGWYGT